MQTRVFQVSILILLLFSAQLGFATEPSNIVGIWKLVSYEVEVQATGEIGPVMGKNPTGYVMFTPQGRVMFVLTGEGRQPAKTLEDRAQLLSTLVAYTGKYRIEGDKWITKVDVAWNPEWIGTEQTRTFSIDGNMLKVVTPWRVMPNWPEKGMQRSLITFQKESDNTEK